MLVYGISFCLRVWAFITSLIILPAVAQVCFNSDLGLSLPFCMPCGSPGLDDFCVKRFGACKQTGLSSFNSPIGWTGGLPPHGYLFGGNPPKSCNRLINIVKQIPNGNLNTGTIRVYGQAADWGRSLPRVFFNPAVLPYLQIQLPLSHCIENRAQFPNGYWNYANPFKPNPKLIRVDSFHYNEDGNSTWSYQCYCDFCYSCQGCTSG